MPSKEDMAYKVATDEQPAESPAAEESQETEETQIQEEASETEEEEAPESETEQEEEESESEQEEEEEPQPKPNRAEKRIQQLTHKLKQTSPKEAGKPVEESPRDPGSELPWNQQEEAEEQEVMEIDQTQLDELIDKRVEERIQQREQATEQRKQAQEWIGDYQSLTGSKSKNYTPELDRESESYNPDLDDLLTSIVSNPDGSPKFNIKVSAALSKVKNSLKIAEKKGTEKASVKLAKQVEEGAIVPGAESEGDEDEYTEDELKDLRINNSREYNRLVKEGKI